MLRSKQVQPQKWESCNSGMLNGEQLERVIGLPSLRRDVLTACHASPFHVDRLAHKAPGETDESVNLYSHTVKFDSSTDQQVPVHSTGVYILVFSNCGEFKNGEVSGSVIAKNSYGFLPGNEYHKMPFYGWLAIVYIAMAMVWMCLSLRYWRELFHIQYCITAVIFLGLVEAFLQWRFFMDWNETGVRGRFVFVLAILATVVKSIFSYMLVLVASLGWGVTRPYLDQPTILKVQALSGFYIILDFMRESALSFRHSHSLSIAFVLLCLLPVRFSVKEGLRSEEVTSPQLCIEVALLNGVIFYWIFTALSSLIEILAERKQQEKLFQLYDLSRSISQRWHYQWFFADGVSHILFCMVLAAIMILFAPQTNSQRFAYKQVEEDEKGESAHMTDDKNVWADEGGLDEEEDDSFWASTHGKGSFPKDSSCAPGSQLVDVFPGFMTGSIEEGGVRVVLLENEENENLIEDTGDTRMEMLRRVRKRKREPGRDQQSAPKEEFFAQMLKVTMSLPVPSNAVEAILVESESPRKLCLESLLA
eukprot:Skav223102  [mRNA]  locus=scaffold419:614755:623350:+ [translate_table: standard]